MAFSHVRQRVVPSTWNTFVATALEGRLPAEVASGTGLSVNQVYVAKNRVLKMLSEEVRHLQR